MFKEIYHSKENLFSFNINFSNLNSLCMRAQLCLTLCDPMNCSPPGSSVREIFPARILEWFAISSSRGSSQPGDQTRVFCIGRWILYHWATWEAQNTCYMFYVWNIYLKYFSNDILQLGTKQIIIETRKTVKTVPLMLYLKYWRQLFLQIAILYLPLIFTSKLENIYSG